MTGERLQGKTNLMTACEQSRALEAKIILQKKPQSIAFRDKHGKTALHYCAESGALPCAQLLVSGADRTLLDAPDSEGFTPLHLAVISGHKSIARLLLRAGADPDSVDKERHSVVHWAAVCGDTESLDLLLSYGANPSTPDILGAYPIHYAAQMCGPHNLNGKDPETGLDTLKKLVQKEASIQCRDKDGREPLLWAASAGSSEAVLILFTAGANISTSDKDGLTALHCAASRGHTACVETLITLCGSKVDSGDHIGCSPLFYASAQGQADCAQVLLKHGADPNRQDNKGRTPAHCAALKGRLEILRILDSNGADLWIRNSRGNLPLHEAVVSGRKDLVQWLLQQCPRAVNATNISGRTPLHIAAQRNNVEMCEVLIDYGAFINPLMVNAKGFLMTPLDASVYQGNQRCAKYLQLHGAVPATKVLENNDINRNLLFSLGNYAYSQKERSDEEPPSSAMFDPTKDILQPSNVRDTQTRTIRGGQQPPLPQAEVPPESELTNVISGEAADASVHIHLTRDDLWSLWESLMEELTSEMSGSELSQGSERKQKLSRKTSEVRQLKPILTNVYLRRESGRSQVIAGESILDRAANQIEVPTRSVSEDPRLRYPRRATDDFKATLPRVSEAEKSKSTEEDRNTASSRISGIDIKEENRDNAKTDGDAFNYFTDSVGSDTENVTSITTSKVTRLKKRRSDARPWVKELEESETSSANRQERKEGNPYMKRYFQRQARAAEMRKYLEAQNFQNEDEYQSKRVSKKQISEIYDDSQEYDDEYHEESTRFPPVDHKGKSKRSKKDSKYNVSTEEVPSKSNKLRRSKPSTALNLDSIHSPRYTSKKRSKEYKHKLYDSEGKTEPENWHSEDCRLKRRHGVETPRKSGSRKHGTSSTRDMGRKSSKNFLEVPFQHSAAASDEHSEENTQEEDMKRRHHHHHHHHHHYYHKHNHRGSVTPEKEDYTSEDHYLEKHHKHKRYYHRKKSGAKDKRYPRENRIQRQTFSDGEYEQLIKDSYSGYNIPRSKSEMSDIPWYGTRDVLTQSPVQEIGEKENSDTFSKDNDLTIISKSENQKMTKEQQSKSSENEIADHEKYFSLKEESDNSKRRKGPISIENEAEKSSSSISQEKQKSKDSQENKKKNIHNGRSISVLGNVKERKESKIPGKPPFKSAQSFSGTLSQKTRDISLKQKSQSARIEKDLPEIKVFSVEGNETNILVRTDFELKDVSEASEITSNGDTFDKNKMTENMVPIPAREQKSDTDTVISDHKDIDENERKEKFTINSPDAEDDADIDDEKPINHDKSLNSEIITEEHLREKEANNQNYASSENISENDIKGTPEETELPNFSEQKYVDTSEDELGSSNEDEPDEILYRDENYALETTDKKDDEIVRNIKIFEDKDESLLTTEKSKNSHSAEENVQQTHSIEEEAEINDKNLLNDETEKIYELKEIPNEKEIIKIADNSEINDTEHLTVCDKFEEEISISNEDNEEKSPFENASLDRIPDKDENATVTGKKYSEQDKMNVEKSENASTHQANADSYENVSEKDENNGIKIDENVTAFEQLSNVDDKSENGKIEETHENATEDINLEDVINHEMEDKNDALEKKQLFEENLGKVDEHDIKQDIEPLSSKASELDEEQLEKSSEKMLSKSEEETTTAYEPHTETQEKEKNVEQKRESIKEFSEDEYPEEKSISKFDAVMKDDEDKQKEIELVEETARNQVLSIIQQAQSEIQKQFGTNALKSHDLNLTSVKENYDPDDLLESQSSAINERIDINIIEATPNLEEPPFVDENADFSEPESASEAETKFNTDSEDTQPEPDLDPELLSEEAQKDDEPVEETREEPTPDLILLAKSLEAETRVLAARDEQQKKDLDRLQGQSGIHKEHSNERNGKVSVVHHTQDTREKQKANHRRHSDANPEEKEDENVNMDRKHRRKSRDSRNRDEEKEDENVSKHGKHRRKSRDNHNREEDEEKEDENVNMHSKHRRKSRDNHNRDGEGENEEENENIHGKHRRKSRDNHNKVGEEVEDDENVNIHDKHRQKSRDSYNNDTRSKHRKHSKPNYLIDESEILEEIVREVKDITHTRNGKLRDSQDLTFKDHDAEITETAHKSIKEKKKKHVTILVKENKSPEKEDYESLITDAKNQRKKSILEESEHISKSQQAIKDTTSEDTSVTIIDKKSQKFPSAEVQTDITGETKLSEIGINVQKEISSHIGFHRSISVQTSDYDTSVVAVLEKVQKEEAVNIPVSTENYKTISIQTEGSDLGVNPILDQSDEIKQAIRTANYNDISGKSRSLAIQCVEIPESTNENAQKVKTVSVGVDASMRSPERQNPGAVFYTAHNKVINESPKKENQNVGALFYAAPSMNDKYDISSISTPNLYVEKISRDQQMGGRGKIPRSTIRDRSLESEKAVAIANTAFRRLNSKGELTVFNSSLITVPQHAPISLVESKPTCRREYSNLEKSGFLWVHFGSGSSPISTIKRKPNLTSQKVKRDSKLIQSHATYRNIEEEKQTGTTKMSSMNRMSRRNEVQNEGNANIYSRTANEKKTVEKHKSQTTKSKTGLNEALHVSSKVLTNKTSQKSNVQTHDKAMDDSKQNEIRSRIPYKYTDNDMKRRVGEFSVYSENNQMKRPNQSQSKGKIPEMVKNEPSPRRAIPRLCRDNSFIKSSPNTPRVKNLKKFDKFSDSNHKNESLDNDSERKINLEIKHEKTSKGRGNLKLEREIQNEAGFNKFNHEEEFSDKQFHFDETNSRLDENLDLEEISKIRKSARKEKKGSSRKQADISNEANIDTSYNDYSFEKEELAKFEQDEIDSLAQENRDMEEKSIAKQISRKERNNSSKKGVEVSNEKNIDISYNDYSFENAEFESSIKEEIDFLTQKDSNKAEAKSKQDKKETQKKSPKKSRKTNSGKKIKQSPKKRNKNITESATNDLEIEKMERSGIAEIDDMEKYNDGITKETEELNDTELEKNNQKVAVKSLKKEVRKKSEVVKKDFLENNEADLLNFQEISNQDKTEDDTTKKQKTRSSRTPRKQSSKNNDERSPKRRDGSSRKKGSGRKDEEGNNPPEGKENDERSPKRRESSSRKKDSGRKDEERYNPPGGKENDERSPKRREGSSRKKDGGRKDEERYNPPEGKENYESSPQRREGSSRRKDSGRKDEERYNPHEGKDNDERSPKRREGSSRKKDCGRKDEERYNPPEGKENGPTSLEPNDDDNHPHPRLSETAKSSSLDEGDVKLVIERKRDPDFSIKISMKDKQKRSRKQKESNNTDFSSTQYESDQSYVKDSGYISTTESVHRHRRSITIDLGHTRAKINAGMKNSSTSYDEENDSFREKISLPVVDKRIEAADDEKRNEQQNPKTPSNKIFPSKLPVLSSHRQISSSVVVTSYSRNPRRCSPTYMNRDEQEDDTNNFDSNRKKDLKAKSPVRQVGHVAEQSAEIFTRYGSGIPIYRAQSDSNLQQLGLPSPRFSGQSVSATSIPELNDLRIPVSEMKMDSILEHSYSSSDIPASVNKVESRSLDNLKLPSIRLSRPRESTFYGSPLSKKSFQSLSPRGKFDRSSKHSSPVSSRMFTPDLGYLKLPILQQAVRCKIEPYEYWDGRRTKSAVDCVANLHFLTEEELAQFDQRLLAIGRRTSFSSDTVKSRSSPTGYRAIRTQTIRGLTYNSKSAESLTFHVDHNKERNSFKLPTEKLKKNKKWKVTFTIGKSKKDKKGKTKELDKS